MNYILKQIFRLEFTYWFNKRIGFYFYKRNNNNKKSIELSIWKYHKIKELKGYEDEWLSNWWTFITLWRNYKVIK